MYIHRLMKCIEQRALQNYLDMIIDEASESAPLVAALQDYKTCGWVLAVSNELDRKAPDDAVRLCQTLCVAVKYYEGREDLIIVHMYRG
jgi:hypothetical protein